MRSGEGDKSLPRSLLPRPSRMGSDLRCSKLKGFALCGLLQYGWFPIVSGRRVFGGFLVFRVGGFSDCFWSAGFQSVSGRRELLAVLDRPYPCSDKVTTGLRIAPVFVTRSRWTYSSQTRKCVPGFVFSLLVFARVCLPPLLPHRSVPFQRFGSQLPRRAARAPEFQIQKPRVSYAYRTHGIPKDEGADSETVDSRS